MGDDDLLLIGLGALAFFALQKKGSTSVIRNVPQQPGQQFSLATPWGGISIGPRGSTITIPGGISGDAGNPPDPYPPPPISIGDSGIVTDPNWGDSSITYDSGITGDQPDLANLDPTYGTGGITGGDAPWMVTSDTQGSFLTGGI